nr:hypothetical protein [uncultured Gemmiger sp.]
MTHWKKTSARTPEQPRTKGRRAAALAGGILIVLLILFVAGYVLGDPVSLAWARHHAMDYANEQWPGNNFTAVYAYNEMGYRYRVRVQSMTSQDTSFDVELSWGVVRSTTYEQDVTGLSNTQVRITEAARQDMTTALNNAGMNPDWLDVQPGKGWESTPEDWGLMLDMPYDPGNLPPLTASFYLVYTDRLPTEADANALLKNAKAAFDAAGLDIAYYKGYLVYSGGKKYEHDINLGPLTAAEVDALP